MPPTPAHMAYQDQSGDLHLMADFAPVTALTIFYIHSHCNSCGGMNVSRKTFEMKETYRLSGACQTM